MKNHVVLAAGTAATRMDGRFIVGAQIAPTTGDQPKGTSTDLHLEGEGIVFTSSTGAATAYRSDGTVI